MMHRVEDRAWVKEFYDAAAGWWGESWYEGENLKPRLEQVEHFAGKAPKKLLELGAGTGETAGYLAAAGYSITAIDISAQITHCSARSPSIPFPLRAAWGFSVWALRSIYAVGLFVTFGMGSDWSNGNCCTASIRNGSLPRALSLWMFITPSARSAKPDLPNRWTGLNRWRGRWI